MKPHTKHDLFFHVFFYSLLIAAAAQFQMNIFSPEFSVSLGIVFLASFSILTEHFPLFPISGLSGLFVLFSRIFRNYINGHTVCSAVLSSLPELGFYVFYGLLLLLYLNRIRSKRSLATDLFALFFCDYLANFGELMLRLNINAFSRSSQSGILITAFFRTLLIAIFISIFRKYYLVLIRKEQKEYLQNLALLTSRLQEEVIWMKKNAAMVESCMRLAYQLFEHLRTDSHTKDAAKDALIMANNIHEIKKEYYLILKGLSEVLSIESTTESISFSELFSILQEPIRQFAASKNQIVKYQISGNTSFVTTKPYCLLSIFRNLFMNAVEASEGPSVFISVLLEETDDTVKCTVSDNGPGIPSDLLPMIFDAGFSTKINYQTGEISRGLGLNIVKSIVEEQLHGSIEVVSHPGQTQFVITFKKTALEE